MRAGHQVDITGSTDRFVVANTQSEAAPIRLADTGLGDARRLPLAMPLVAVERMVTVGTSAVRFDAEALQQKLQNALARFDEVRVRVDPSPPSDAQAGSRPEPIDYRLAATLDAQAADAPQLTFRLLDGADNSVVWSKTYRNV